MKEKSLKRMSRRDLVDLIYEMKKRELELETELHEAKEQLAERALIMEKAGSIANAALGINKVFEAAQQAAEDYLASLKQVYPDADALVAEAREYVPRSENAAEAAEVETQEEEAVSEAAEAQTQEEEAISEAAEAETQEEEAISEAAEAQTQEEEAACEAPELSPAQEEAPAKPASETLDVSTETMELFADAPGLFAEIQGLSVEEIPPELYAELEAPVPQSAPEFTIAMEGTPREAAPASWGKEKKKKRWGRNKDK